MIFSENEIRIEAYLRVRKLSERYLDMNNIWSRTSKISKERISVHNEKLWIRMLEDSESKNEKASWIFKNGHGNA